MLNKLIFTIVFLGNTLLFAQTGRITGRVRDKILSEGVAFSSVALEQKGVVVSGTVADINGEFSFHGLTPGIYDLRSVCVGYQTFVLSGITVSADTVLDASVEMEDAPMICCCCCWSYGCSFVDAEETSLPSNWFPDSLFSDSSEVSKKIQEESYAVCKVYPNPFMDFAVLEVASALEVHSGIVKLFDLTGKEVRSQSFSGGTAVIERGNLAAGTYTYEINADNISITGGRIAVQ